MPTKQEQAEMLRYDARWMALCGLGVTEQVGLGSGLESDMLQTAGDLRAQMIERAETQRAIKSFQAEVAEIKNDILLSEVIDGKNAEIRATQLAKALAETLSYQAGQKMLDQYQRRLDEMTAEIEYLTNKLAAQRAEMRRITAVLAALADS